MKKVIIALCVTSAFLVLLRFQAATEDPPIEEINLSKPIPVPSDTPMPGWIDINPTTLEAISPDGDQKKVDYLNTPEMITARARSRWSIIDPISYQKAFPLNDAQAEASNEATLSMMFPEAYNAWLNTQKTPERLREEALAIQSFARGMITP